MDLDSLTRQITAIAHAMEVILEPGQWVEVRSIGPARNRMFQYGTEADLKTLATYAAKLCGQCKGVYYTPNPVTAGQASGPGGAVTDGDIERRNWLLIDVDSVRPKDCNANDAEKAAALAVADTIADTLTALGMGGIVRADSGNGYHVMAPVRLPNDETTRIAVRRFLLALDERFSNASATVDTKTFNAGRIWKLPYTLTMKGEATPDRPQRWARIASLPHDPHGHAVRNTEIFHAIDWPVTERDRTKPDGSAYVQAAIDRECGRVARAASGERNNVLNVAAFNLGQFVGGGLVGRAEIEAALMHAARGCGLDDHEAGRTIKSGIDAGKEKPRTIPCTITTTAATTQDGETLEPVNEWDEPVPVDTAGVDGEFPVDVLPTLLQRFAREESWSKNVPVDYVGLAMLAVAGGAIGNSRRLLVKHGYTQSASIYGAFVARPGSRKSAVIKGATAPLAEAERALRDRWQAEMTAWEQSGANGTPPQPKRLMVSGGTTEGIVRRLAANARGLTIANDEISGLVLGMNQYKPGGKGNDKQFFLSSWDQQHYQDERVDAGRTVYIERPFLSIIGAIQPDVLPTLRGVDNRGKVTADDGFFDRFLIAYPPENPERAENWAAVSDSTAALWRDAIDYLLQAPPMTAGSTDGLLYLSLGAKQAYQDFTAENADEVNAADFDDSLRGPWSKLMGYFCRLMLILHALDEASDGEWSNQVSERTVGRAARLVRYFKTQAKRAAGVIARDDRATAAGRVLDWLRARPDPTQPVRHREILKNLQRQVRNSENLIGIMNYLADLGHVQVIEETPARRQLPAQCRRANSTSYLLNPHSLASKKGTFAGASARPKEIVQWGGEPPEQPEKRADAPADFVSPYEEAF